MIKNVLIGIALVTGIAGLTLSLMKPTNKLAFIEMGKVYEEFVLTKELNGELEKVLKARKLVTDSLFEDFREKTREVKEKEKKTMEDVQRLARLEEEYVYKKDLFEKDNQQVSAEYNNKIWNQLNQYLQDYGEANKLTLIFGANGQGNIMYGEAAKNITKEVVAYVNDRYNDKLKK